MSRHIHILGICGTFMGSLAQLARAAGWRVTGCDTAVYPPMSEQLNSAGIEVVEGFTADQLALNPELFVVGNVVSRGNPLMEAILNRGLAYCSGPQWLAEHLLRDKWVLAVSGTHGKTTTSSMLAWILEYAGYDPSFLIGGVPGNFGVSARLSDSAFFVIEADEYDTAFFDKRSKFVHYRPRTLTINNLEHDHADIFPNLAAIQTQFHHLIRTVPENGMIIVPQGSKAIDEVLRRGCWSSTQSVGESDSDTDWQFRVLAEDYSQFTVQLRDADSAEVMWSLAGRHNVENAVNAIAAARYVGVQPSLAAEALARFQGVKRRMEVVDTVGGITVYDDFAHHPTAIATSLDGMRRKIGAAPLWLVIEPRSNTMRLGVHNDTLLASTRLADRVCWFDGGLDWHLDAVVRDDLRSSIYADIDALVESLTQSLPSSAHVLVMSNGGFGGVHRKLVAALRDRERDCS